MIYKHCDNLEHSFPAIFFLNSIVKLTVTIGAYSDRIVISIGSAVRKRPDMMNLKEWVGSGVSEGGRFAAGLNWPSPSCEP